MNLPGIGPLAVEHEPGPGKQVRRTSSIGKRFGSTARQLPNQTADEFFCAGELHEAPIAHLRFGLRRRHTLGNGHTAQKKCGVMYLQGDWTRRKREVENLIKGQSGMATLGQKKKKDASKKHKKRKSTAVRARPLPDRAAIGFVEDEEVSPALRCTCKRGRDRHYQAHLCPLERRNVYSLQRTRVTEDREARVLERQLLRDVVPGWQLGLEGCKDSAWCAAQAARYQTLLRERADEPESTPAYAPAFVRLATLLNALEEYDDASAHAATACRLDPYHAASWFQHAFALLRLDRRQEACEALLRGLEWNPRNPRLEGALATLT